LRPIIIFNFGLGYEHPLKQTLSINLELVGDEGPVTRNQLQLLLGLSSHPTSMLWIFAICFQWGFYDASPDYAVGAKVEWRFFRTNQAVLVYQHCLKEAQRGCSVPSTTRTLAPAA